MLTDGSEQSKPFPDIFKITKVDQNVSSMPNNCVICQPRHSLFWLRGRIKAPKNECPLETSQGKVSCVEACTPFGCLDLCGPFRGPLNEHNAHYFNSTAAEVQQDGTIESQQRNLIS